MPRTGTTSLRRAHDAAHEIDRVLQLSIQGIFQISRSVALVEALAQFDFEDGTTPAESERRLAVARSDAEFAQREVEREFPVVHAHAAVALWGVIEAAIEDLVLECLEADIHYLATPLVAAIKVPVGEYEALDRQDRLRLILAEYARNVKAERKLGVSRFEVLLELVQLAGPIEEQVRRDILEHQQIRNVLVHRGGLADRRLATLCPWLDLAVGGPVRVSHSQYGRYSRAIARYLMELLVRILVKDGVTREEAEARLRRSSGSAED